MMTLSQAEKILKKEYDRAVDVNKAAPGMIKDPVTWALYKAWRAADAKNRKDKKR